MEDVCPDMFLIQAPVAPQSPHPASPPSTVPSQFWTRPTGVYGKPVWMRDDVLQLFYDDDNTELSFFSGPTVPGGHAAFTRTAVIYSDSPIDAASIALDTDPATEALRKQVPAFTQRVGSCYLVEAGLLGFADAAAGESAGLDEQRVLSTAMRWAIADYRQRHGGTAPASIVLHCDVNGTLSLGDVASSKTFGKQAKGLATDILKRAQNGQAHLNEMTTKAIQRAATLDEDHLRQEYTTYYSEEDLISTLSYCLRVMNAELAEAERGLGGPLQARQAELTLAIRTNGVEAENAALFLCRQLRTRMGIDLDESDGLVKRYVMTHEDRARGLFFHPVRSEHTRSHIQSRTRHWGASKQARRRASTGASPPPCHTPLLRAVHARCQPNPYLLVLNPGPLSGPLPCRRCSWRSWPSLQSTRCTSTCKSCAPCWTSATRLAHGSLFWTRI